ncbi:unnamed protein product, partial [Adineta steineri]
VVVEVVVEVEVVLDVDDNDVVVEVTDVDDVVDDDVDVVVEVDDAEVDDIVVGVDDDVLGSVLKNMNKMRQEH